MNKLRVYADPQKTDDGGRLILVCQGTQDDLEAHGLTLAEGMPLSFWRDDADDAGNPDPLHFEGVVHYDESARQWVAEVDWDTLRHASEESAAERPKESALR